MTTHDTCKKAARVAMGRVSDMDTTDETRAKAVANDLWEEWNTRAAPKVKPLEWDNAGGATSVVGQYYIHKTKNKRNEKYMVCYISPKRSSFTLGYIDGEEAAKAAAQADYERRILSALVEG